MGLEKLPEWFGWLENLKWVTLENNKLTAIDKDQLPASLLDLNLAENEITSIDVSNLTHLTTLDLQRNQLKTLDLANLTHLTTLNLGSNKLETLDLTNLPNLK